MLAFDRARKEIIEEIGQWKKNPLMGTTFHKESLESADELIAINRLGMLTFDSQQGRLLIGNVPLDRKLYAKLVPAKHQMMNDDESGRDPNLVERKALRALEKEYVKRGGRFRKGIVEKERAYLDGVVSAEIAKPLADWLNQQSNVVAIWIPSSPASEDERSDFYPSSIGVTYDLESGASTLRRWPLMRKSAIPLGPNRPSNAVVIELTEKEKKQLDKDYVFLHVFDARYGHSVTQPDGLFKIVIQGLKLFQGKTLGNVIQ